MMVRATFSTSALKHLNNACMSHHGGSIQHREAFSVQGVHIRAGRDEKFCNGLVVLIARSMQGRSIGEVHCVDICSVHNQQLSDFGVP